MGMKLILATKNRHKVEELKALLAEMPFEILSLLDFPELPEVIEDGNSFLENAQKKARTAAKQTGILSLGDDSGLVVEALDGRPGINSARYCGKEHDYKANNLKILSELKNISHDKRKAAFICTMVLVDPSGKEWNVEGQCNGIILDELIGDKGFGYDPIFYIPKLGKTMAELTMKEKNAISHRGKALQKIKKILLSVFGV